jgi:hypothetical protein
MKLKSSLVIALLAVALSAVVAVAAPSADAKKKTGSVSTPAAGVTTAGAPVTGTFNITSFKLVDGAITAVGTFTGSVDGGITQVTTPATSVVQAANGTPLTGGTSAPAAAAAAAGTCSILDLTLGPLHLDLLGLVVDLNQVHLQITAEQGSGNLLGNLLCAVAGLLDNTGTGGLSGLLQAITNLLNQILGQL